jgi:hypothetical protein
LYEETKAQNQEFVCVGSQQVPIPKFDLEKVIGLDEKEESELALIQSPVDYHAVRKQLAQQLLMLADPQRKTVVLQELSPVERGSEILHRHRNIDFQPESRNKRRLDDLALQMEESKDTQVDLAVHEPYSSSGVHQMVSDIESSMMISSRDN